MASSNEQFFSCRLMATSSSTAPPVATHALSVLASAHRNCKPIHLLTTVPNSRFVVASSSLSSQLKAQSYYFLESISVVVNSVPLGISMSSFRTTGAVVLQRNIWPVYFHPLCQSGLVHCYVMLLLPPACSPQLTRSHLILDTFFWSHCNGFRPKG